MAKAPYIKLNKTGKAQIKETVKAVRSANAAAHEARLDNCTAAAGTTLIDGSIAPDAPAPAAAKAKPKAKVLSLTSPAKMGAARKAKKKAKTPTEPKAKSTPATPAVDSKAVGEKVMAANTKRQAGLANWTPPKNIDPALAETCAKLYIRGTTSRQILDATGLDSKQRLVVDKSLSLSGYAFHRELNPARDKSDPLTRFIFKRTAPAA